MSPLLAPGPRDVRAGGHPRPRSLRALGITLLGARDDPHASLATLLLTASASVLFAVPAIAGIRRLSRHEGPSTP